MCETRSRSTTSKRCATNKYDSPIGLASFHVAIKMCCGAAMFDLDRETTENNKKLIWPKNNFYFFDVFNILIEKVSERECFKLLFDEEYFQHFVETFCWLNTLHDRIRTVVRFTHLFTIETKMGRDCPDGIGIKYEIVRCERIEIKIIFYYKYV